MDPIPAGIPKKIGKYTLIGQLGSGGMGEVYLAELASGNLTKRVALKMMLPAYSANPDLMRLFKSEAEIAIQLSHNNVASMYEYGLHYTRVFMVMEYIDGLALNKLRDKLKLKNDRFSLPEIIYIIREAAAGLDYLHRAKDQKTHQPLNLVHRDVSPHNIMVNREGEIKLIDFGVAKPADTTEASRSEPVIGKLRYLSPQQVEQRGLNHQTDIYSLGVVLWELLANEKIFTNMTQNETLIAIVNQKIPPLPKEAPGNPQILAILDRMLAKDLQHRYKSAEDLYRDLSSLLAQSFPDYTARDFQKRIQAVGLDTPLVGKPQNAILNIKSDNAMANPVLTPAKSSTLLRAMALSAMCAAAIALVRYYPLSTNSQTEVGTANQSSYAVAFSITSKPSGAVVYIDGQNTGYSTPARVPLAADLKQKLTLKLPGYRECHLLASTNNPKLHCQMVRE